MAKEINILNFKCSSLNLLLMNIVEVNMSDWKWISGEERSRV